MANLLESMGTVLDAPIHRAPFVVPNNYYDRNMVPAMSRELRAAQRELVAKTLYELRFPKDIASWESRPDWTKKYHYDQADAVLAALAAAEDAPPAGTLTIEQKGG